MSHKLVLLLAFVGMVAHAQVSIEGTWTLGPVSVVGGSCTPTAQLGQSTTIIRQGPDSFAFPDYKTTGTTEIKGAFSDEYAPYTSTLITGVGPGEYTWQYRQPETRTATGVAMDMALTLTDSNTLQVDLKVQEEYDPNGVLPHTGEPVPGPCTFHVTGLRSGLGAGGLSTGTCASWEDCATTGGYMATIAGASGLLGLMGSFFGAQLAGLIGSLNDVFTGSMQAVAQALEQESGAEAVANVSAAAVTGGPAGAVDKTLDAGSTAASIADFLSDTPLPNVSNAGALGAGVDLGKQIFDLVEQGDATTGAILAATANTDVKLAIDVLIQPVGSYDAVAGAANFASGMVGGQPVLPTVDPLAALKDLETAIVPSDAIPQPAPMEPIFLPPDANWAQQFVDQTSNPPDISSMTPPTGANSPPTDDLGDLNSGGGDDS